MVWWAWKHVRGLSEVFLNICKIRFNPFIFLKLVNVGIPSDWVDHFTMGLNGLNNLKLTVVYFYRSIWESRSQKALNLTRYKGQANRYGIDINFLAKNERLILYFEQRNVLVNTACSQHSNLRQTPYDFQQSIVLELFSGLLAVDEIRFFRYLLILCLIQKDISLWVA